MKLLLLLHLFCFTCSALNFPLIGKYFQARHVTKLNMFLCMDLDGIQMRKNEMFRSFLASISVETEVDWNSYSFYEKPIGFFVDLGCEFNRDLFRQIPGRFFGSGSTWLVLGKEMEDSGFGLSSDVSAVDPETGEIRRLRKPHPTAPVTWVPCPGVNCPPPLDNIDLGGRPLTASVINFMHLTDDDEGKRKYEKLIAQNFGEENTELIIHKYFMLNQLVAQRFNFSYSYIFTDDYGLMQPNGTFNGTIGDVTSGRADVAIQSVTILSSRLGLMDFAVAIEDVKFIVVFLEARSLGGPSALAIPFSLPVWLVTTAVSFLALIASYAVFYVYYPGNVFSEAVLNVIGVISAQGVQEMEVASSRVLNFFLLTLGLLLATYYNAAIMQGLLSPTPVLIKNIHDLIKSRKIGVANLTYLKPIYIHPLIKKTFTKETPRYEIPEGIRKIQNEEFALVGHGRAMNVLLENMLTDSQKCNIRELDMQGNIPISVPLAKYSHYKEMFSRGYIWLLETGLDQKAKKIWYPDPPECLGGNIFEPIGLRAVFIAYVVYISGLALSLFLFLFETYYWKRRQNKMIKKITNKFPSVFLP